MRSPLAFLRFVARAALNAVGGGVAGDLAVDVMPDVARDVWHWWGKDTPQQQLRNEVEAVAQLPPDEVRELAGEAVAAEAADKPEALRQSLAGLLQMLPQSIRQSQRRPEDPAGSTVAAHFALHSADDVRRLLPARLPRFRPGQRVPGFSDWVLEALLGMGGFGEVWRARNPHMPDPVAFKFCLDAGAARWLQNEAEVLRHVIQKGHHPGIVALLDTNLSGDPPCLKYAYVAGGDLCGLVEEWRQNPPERRVADATRLMHQLAEIVAFAHRLSPPIVHRDLKPANVLMQPTPEGLAPRVADFGIGGVASRQAAEATQGGTTRGYVLGTELLGSCTPLYASPQQLRGDKPDPRDDVHALGVVWLQLLTGDLTAGASADWRDGVQPLGAPEGVMRLLGLCLSSRADRRPADAGVLAEELAMLLPGGASAGAVPATTRPFPAPRTPAPDAPRFLTNALGMKFVLIPAGTFRMGSPDDEAERSDDEGPQHAVTITRPFYLGVHPVTQEQFQRLMGTNPSHFSRAGRGKGQVKDDDPRLLPVEKVTWGSAVAFCRKLSELPEEAGHGRRYRLPTEAEWEHACRAGKVGEPFHFGDSLGSTQANFDGRQPYGSAAAGPYLKRPTAVGSYPPNDWGLFDLHGNVWEWCQDWYAEDYYARSPAEDPAGPEAGEQRVLRGGCWSSSGANCRSAYRGRSEPGNHVHRFGLRVILDIRDA